MPSDFLQTQEAEEDEQGRVYTADIRMKARRSKTLLSKVQTPDGADAAAVSVPEVRDGSDTITTLTRMGPTGGRHSSGSKMPGGLGKAYPPGTVGGSGLGPKHYSAAEQVRAQALEAQAAQAGHTQQQVKLN